jgi:malate synthase
VGGAQLDDGRFVTGGLYSAIRDEELAALGGPAGGSGHLAEAAELLDGLVLEDTFTEFLTIPAGALLD